MKIIHIKIMMLGCIIGFWGWSSHASLYNPGAHIQFTTSLLTRDVRIFPEEFVRFHEHEASLRRHVHQLSLMDHTSPQPMLSSHVQTRAVGTLTSGAELSSALDRLLDVLTGMDSRTIGAHERRLNPIPMQSTAISVLRELEIEDAHVRTRLPHDRENYEGRPPPSRIAEISQDLQLSASPINSVRREQVPDFPER